MAEVATVAALLLAAVFAAAGLGKLRRGPATARAFVSLRLPAPTALAVAVPAAELALALVLVARPRAGGVLALAALGAFSTVLAGATRSGTAVRCGCFGTTSERPVSAADLVRNGLLATAAVAALGAPVPVRPTLAATVLVTTGALIAGVALALQRLRLEVGALWDNRLAGEAAS